MRTFVNYLKEIRSMGRRSFTIEKAAKDLNTTRQAIISAVYRLKRQGDLISPAKGFYVMVPPEDQAFGSIPARELIPLLMKHYNADYYVGLLSAGVHHGATHQKPRAFQIVTNKRIKSPLVLGRIHVEFVYKKSLENCATKTIVVDTGHLKYSSPELTAMDLFLYPSRCGGLNHIATVLSELIDAIDPDKLIALAKSSKDKFWVQRMGYILQRVDPWNNEKNNLIIKKLSKYVASLKKLHYIPIAPEIPTAGSPRNAEWKIIENTTVEGDDV